MKHKKGQIEQLGMIVTALVAIGILIAISSIILAEINDQAVSQESLNGYAQNATIEVQSALTDIPGWLSIIIITTIGALLLGLVQLFRGN